MLFPFVLSDGDLCAEFNDTVGRQTVKARGRQRVRGQLDIEPVVLAAAVASVLPKYIARAIYRCAAEEDFWRYQLPKPAVPLLLFRCCYFGGLLHTIC